MSVLFNVCFMDFWWVLRCFQGVTKVLLHFKDALTLFFHFYCVGICIDVQSNDE